MEDTNCNFTRIELKNRKKVIVGYTLVDNNDYENVSKYRWHLSNSGYVKAQVNKKTTFLSHFIFGKPKHRHVIDHKNNNPLDNRRCNLQEATYSQNAQNKKKTTKETSSIYIGVCFTKNKWKACSSGKHLGTFESEYEAAVVYDKYVYIKYGKDASTNSLVQYNAIINLSVDDIIVPKTISILPKNISLTVDNKFKICIINNKIKYNKICDTLDDAINELKIYKDNFSKNILENNSKKIITRNANNQAIINMCNNDNIIVDSTLVDDNQWHNLIQYGWYLNNNYAVANINNKLVRLHRYLLNAREDKVVDHINNNPLDNRLKNLRLATIAENSYNKSKNLLTSSKYKGVSRRTGFDNYIVSIQKNNISYNLGLYYNEDIAGLAYNIKAIELFGEFANLNSININDETRINYENIINEIWNKEKKVYKGINLIKDCTSENKYEGRIKYEGKMLVLGRYNHEIIAAIAYNLKAVELYGDKARLNIIEIDSETYNKHKNDILAKWTIKNNKKYFGVSYDKDSNKYRARITQNRKVISIGRYTDEIAAAIAYNLKSTELNGSKAKLNTIDIDEKLYENYKKEILKTY